MGVFANALIRDEDILNYIPQRNPIVMLDTFYGIEANKSYTGLKINGNNVFCEKGIFLETGMIEHVAQSAAFRVGYEKISQGLPVPLGFIGSVSKCKIHELPKVGDVLRTTVTIEVEMMNITLISAIVESDQKIMAECQMKIFLQQENEHE